MVALNGGTVPSVIGARGGWVSWPLLVFVLFYVALIPSRMLLNDPGVWWHVATGNLILDSGAIPHTDPFTHTAPGAKWEPSEWLAEVAMALVHRAFGYGGVAAMGAFAGALTLALLNRLLLRSLEPIHALLLTLLAALGVLPHVIARPHMLAMPLLVIWVAKLVDAVDRRETPTYWLLPVMTLWANLHGGFALGIGLCGLLALEAMLTAGSLQAAVRCALRWAPFVVLAILASLATPHHVDGYLLILKLLSMKFTLSTIAEWKSPDFQRDFSFTLWLLLALGIVLIRGIRLPPTRALLSLLLLYFALTHIRTFENLTLLVPLLVAAPLAAQLRAAPAVSTARPGLAALDRLLENIGRKAHAQGLIAALAGIVALTAAVNAASDFRPTDRFSPVAAVDSIQGLELKGPVLNHLNFGGYLIRRGIPVFIDDRTQIQGDDFFKEYMQAAFLQESGPLEELLDRWQIGWTLLYPNTPAVALLDHLPGWRRHYADDIAVVHVREAAPDRIINR
jgi:hypothetical protein